MTDYAKDFRQYYFPGPCAELIGVPAFRFVTLEGQGDPNAEPFAEATSALYSFSYAVKMSYKSKDIPEGYFEYKVFPLEGVWDLADKSVTDISVKDNYQYKIMIRQPDFLTDTLFERFISECKRKKPNANYDKLSLETIAEGLCCQMMHIGGYDEEPESFARMDDFCRQNGCRRASLTHREIYLSDPRKTEKVRLRTVLRYKVDKV